MRLDELKEHCLKTLKQTKKFPTKTFEEHVLVLQLIENQTSVIAELEKIKTEMQDNLWYSLGDRKFALKTIDNHINELKGNK